jgi:hypothetical protein
VQRTASAPATNAWTSWSDPVVRAGLRCTYNDHRYHGLIDELGG